MNILLINKNPVISKLITLCLHDDSIMFEELEDLFEIKDDSYDIVFIDSSSYTPLVDDYLSHINAELKILLLPSNSTLNYDDNIFTYTIEKPFLPSQIKKIIDTLPQIVNREDTKSKSEILNVNEIEKIKSILVESEENIPLVENRDYESRKVELIKEHLEADGLEIVVENDIVDILSKKNSSKKRKKKKSKSIEDKIIKTLIEMKPKKLKKLLSGAEININIKFKDSN